MKYPGPRNKPLYSKASYTVNTGPVHTNVFSFGSVFKCLHSGQRFQMYAFSMKTLSVVVWTIGENASKGMRFKRKRISADGALDRPTAGVRVLLVSAQSCWEISEIFFFLNILVF